MSGGQELGLGFHRARPSHGDEFIPADFDVERADNGLLSPCGLQYIRAFGKEIVPAFAHGLLLHSGESSGYSERPKPCLHPKIEMRRSSQSGKGKDCVQPHPLLRFYGQI